MFKSRPADGCLLSAVSSVDGPAFSSGVPSSAWRLFSAPSSTLAEEADPSILAWLLGGASAC